MKTFQAWVLLSLMRLSHSFSPAKIRSPRAPPVEALAMTTKKVEVLESDAEAFERVTLARRATKRFEPRPVPDDLLKKVLALVLRAPSGFNMQPYECIVVTSNQAKQKLSRAMLGENRQRVLDAGATVVFASDLNSMKNANKVKTLLEKEGWPTEFIRKFPLYLSVFSTGHNRFFRQPLLLTKRLTFAIAKRLGKPLPTVSGAEAWTFKNTMLAVQVSMLGPMALRVTPLSSENINQRGSSLTSLVPYYRYRGSGEAVQKPTVTAFTTQPELLLAATSCGLASCPMEGFDMRRLRKELAIPLRYSVPIVVSIGYASPLERDFKTLRFPPEEVYHRDEFGTTLEGVPVL